MILVLKVQSQAFSYVNVQPVCWSALHILRLLELLPCSQVTSGDNLYHLCILIHNDQGV
jgi:hypothetical protein